MNRRITSNLSKNETIIHLLETELALQERHLWMLREQRIALIACNRKRFMILHTDYEGLLAQLQEQALHRGRIIRGNADWLNAQMATWPEGERAHVAAVIDALRVLLAEVQKQSAENRVLIANEQKFINFELNLIIGAIIKGVNYIKTGARASIQMNRLINRTV